MSRVDPPVTPARWLTIQSVPLPYSRVCPQTEGAAACGMCIEVTKVENMPLLSTNNTSWDYGENISVPFLAMVFDQCDDPVCDQNGYLDFDIYNQTQPVAHGESPEGRQQVLTRSSRSLSRRVRSQEYSPKCPVPFRPTWALSSQTRDFRDM